MISLLRGRSGHIALGILGGTMVIASLVVNNSFCDAYIFNRDYFRVTEPLRVYLRADLVRLWQFLGFVTGMALVCHPLVITWGGRFLQSRVGRLLIGPPNYKCLSALVPLMLAETIYWVAACRCDEVPLWLPVTVITWLHSVAVSVLLFLLIAVALAKLLRFRYLPLVLSLVWATAVGADTLLYWFGNTRFEAKFWGMATSESLSGFVGARTVLFVLTMLGLCLASGWLLVKPVAAMRPAACLKIILLLVAIIVADIPYRIFSISQMLVDGSKPSAVGELRGHFLRLKYIGRDSVLNAGLQCLPKGRTREVADLKEFSPAISHYGLPLGKQCYEPRATRPFRRVVMVFCESFSSFFLKSCNPGLPDTVTPFLDSPAIAPWTFRNHRTSAQPTTQGLSVTFCSHPNPVLLLQAGIPHSFMRVMRDNGWHTAFFSSATQYFDNKKRNCTSAGIQDFLGAESLSENISDAKYRLDWGMCDRILYQRAKDYISAHRNEPLFVAIEGADTHVPDGRARYGDLKYPPTPDWITKHEMAGFLTSVFRMDYDLAAFAKGLKDDGLLDEDTLLIITADHCFPSSPLLKSLPGTTNSAFERIPLIVLSGRKLPPADHNRPTSQLDVAPSLLHLLGLPIPQGYWGKSIFDPRPNPTPFVGIFRDTVTIANQRASESFELSSPGNPAQKSLAGLLMAYLKEDQASEQRRKD